MTAVAIGRLVLALCCALCGAPELSAQRSSNTPLPLQPGQHLKIAFQVAEPMPGAIEEVEGDLVSIDSAAFTLAVGDSSRPIPRAAVRSVKRRTGPSRFKGLVAGWIAAIPFAYFSCRDEKVECGQGSAIGLAGMLGGALVGWPQWEDVP